MSFEKQKIASIDTPAVYPDLSDLLGESLNETRLLQEELKEDLQIALTIAALPDTHEDKERLIVELTALRVGFDKTMKALQENKSMPLLTAFEFWSTYQELNKRFYEFRRTVTEIGEIQKRAAEPLSPHERTRERLRRLEAKLSSNSFNRYYSKDNPLEVNVQSSDNTTSIKCAGNIMIIISTSGSVIDDDPDKVMVSVLPSEKEGFQILDPRSNLWRDRNKTELIQGFVSISQLEGEI